MTSLARAGFWVAAYIGFIIVVNVLFVPSNLIEGVTQWTTNTWAGTLYLANIIVGFVFVLRDYAQREIGHKVLLATALAALPVWYFAGPSLAFASLVAFALSELTDWAVYSFTQRPLQARILLSSLLSIPVDTAVFQNLAGYYSHLGFVAEMLSKAVGVAVVWYLLRMRIGNAETPMAANRF